MIVELSKSLPVEVNTGNSTIELQAQEAQENACERVTIGFGFTSDWMKKWRESFKPIT